MPNIIKLNTHTDHRGSLTVIEKILPFDVKRVYYIYDIYNSERGHHAHKKTIQALIMLNGSCNVFVGEENHSTKYEMNSPNECLILMPEDFHWMNNFSENSILLILASEEFDKEDYIYEN
jgi:hypothetical protein